MSNPTAQLDATMNVVTPENISFQYRVAGPFRRLPAFLLDLLLRAGIITVLYFAVAMLSIASLGNLTFSGMMVAVLIVSWFVVSWFYGGLFETYMNGQTPGKIIMRIRVLTVDGQPIGGMQAIMRNLMRDADMFPLLSIQLLGAPVPFYVIPTFGLGLIVMMLNRRFQRLGDIVCGTVVVMEERKWLAGVAKLEDPRAAQLAEYIPTNFVVSRSLARALAAFVDRRRFFSQPRRTEVAKFLAEPLLREFGMAADTSYDLLLCALYYRTFVADRPEELEALPPSSENSGEPPWGGQLGHLPARTNQ